MVKRKIDDRDDGQGDRPSRIKRVHGRKGWWVYGFVLLLLLISMAHAQLKNTIMGTIQESLNTLSSAQRKQNQIQQKQQQQKDLNMGNQQRPDDLGLGCSMLPTTPPHRIPLCQPRPPSPEAPLKALILENLHRSQIFQSNAQLYKNQLQSGASLHTPQGIKCLEERNENLNASFTQIEQDLENLLRVSKEQDQALFGQIGGEVNKMKDLNSLLEGRGSGGAGQMDKKAINYTSLFQNSACRQVITNGQVRKTGQGSGLRGIRDTVLNATQDKAKEIQSLDFQGLVQERLNTINSRFARSGLEGIQNYNQATSGRDAFGSLKNAYNDFYKDFNQKMKSVQRDLKRYLPGLGAGKVPSLDKNFARHLNQIQKLGRSDHGGSWKDRFMNSCMSGKIPGGAVQGGFDLLINRLRRRGFSGKDEQLKYYKSFFRSLRDSQNSMTSKRAALVKFHQEQMSRSRYGVTILAPEGGELDVLEYFDQDMINCNRQFSTLRVFQDGPTGTALTYKEARTRALKSIAKGKQDFINFPQEMEKAVKGKALRCEGITYNPTPTKNGGCSTQGEGALNRQSATFCQAHAQTCAQAVNSCFGKLDREIKMREGERKQMANRINHMMNTYRQTLNARLKSTLNQVKQFHIQLKKTYPFLSPLELKESELFIPILTPQWNEALKEAIVDGGNPVDIQKSFEKLLKTNIQQSLNRQRNSIKSKIAKEIQDKKKAYREAQKNWESLVQQCHQVVDGYKKQMQEQEKKYQEDIVARNVICSITEQLDTTSCSVESLTQLDEAFTQLSQTLARTPDRLYGISEFKADCAGLNSSLTQREERESQEIKPAAISQMCDIGEEIEGKVKKAAEEKEEYQVPKFRGIPEDHYSRFGLDPDQLSRLTGVTPKDIRDYVKNSKGKQETLNKLRRVSNPSVNQQISSLSALSNKKFIEECNQVRQGFSRRLYNSLRENRSTRRSVTRADYSDSQIETYVELEDEALEGAVRNSSTYAIETLIRTQRSYQNRPMAFGLGEQTIPLCRGLKDRRNPDPPREEDHFVNDIINTVISNGASEEQ